MKVHTETAPVEKSGLTQQEQVFTIKATGKAFSILSSGLYSDKILAVVRELSCNAYDSHVAAGKADVPIEIKLPSSMDPTFHVKDFGTGLSHEQVLKLYTTYFDSTKQDSNDFIGALGLGSKSPFSYVSNFMVESRFDGIKNVYSCFINEEQLPSIVGLGAFDMEEGETTGMTIILSVKRDDHNKFYQAAKKALMYFNPKPHVIGTGSFETYDLKHTVTGSNWKIRQTDYYAYMNGPYVVQGFVAYPIDGTTIKEHGLTKTAAALAEIGIDFSVDIGDIEVAASREALQYDKRTVANLVNVFEQAALEIRQSFQESFDKCANLWEVGSLLEELETSDSYEFRNIFSNLNREKPFTWNDKPVSKTIHLDMSGIKTTQVSVYTTKKSGLQLVNSNAWAPSVASIRVTDWDIDVSRTTFVVVDTEAKGNNDIYRRYLNSLPTKKIYNRLVVIRPTHKQGYNQTEIDKLLSSIGAEHKFVKDLGFVVEKKVSQYQKKDKSVKLFWTGFVSKEDRYGKKYAHKVYSRNTWNTLTIDLEEGGFYVPIERFTPVHNGEEIVDLDQLITHAKELGILAEYPVVYGFTQADINKLSDDSDWTNLYEYIKLKFVRMNSTGQLTEKVVLDKILDVLGPNFVTHTIQQWDKVDARLNDGDFKVFMAKLVDMNNNSHSFPKQHVTGLSNQLNVLISSEASTVIIDELTEEWAALNRKYEMLYFVERYMSEQAVLRMLRYINMVEKTLDV